MALTMTEEQSALREVMRSFIAKHATEECIRKTIDSHRDFDADTWSVLAEQIGATALAIPEHFGGGGFGFGELLIVMEESGAALLPSPLLESAVLATYTLLESGDTDACAELLPELADGSRIGTVAFADNGLDLRVGRTDTHARPRDEGGWSVTGQKAYVLGAPSADLLIVAAASEGGDSLFVVDTAADGVSVDQLDGMDLTRTFARVRLDDVQARLLGNPGSARAVIRSVTDYALVALAGEQIGAAGAVLERTVDYLKVRQQFGRPIGSFQALKHRCADMLVELESARSAVAYAAEAIAKDSDDREVAAAIAKVYCSKSLYHLAAESIQMHGGIGFTWEHHAHLYFKRAKTSEVLFGSPSSHSERIGQLVGLSSDSSGGA